MRIFRFQSRGNEQGESSLLRGSLLEFFAIRYFCFFGVSLEINLSVLVANLRRFARCSENAASSRDGNLSARSDQEFHRRAVPRSNEPDSILSQQLQIYGSTWASQRSIHSYGFRSYFEFLTQSFKLAFFVKNLKPFRREQDGTTVKAGGRV